MPRRSIRNSTGSATACMRVVVRCASLSKNINRGIFSVGIFTSRKAWWSSSDRRVGRTSVSAGICSTYLQYTKDVGATRTPGVTGYTELAYQLEHPSPEVIWARAVEVFGGEEL